MYNDPAKKKILYIGIAAALLIVVVIFILTRGGVSSYSHKYSGHDMTLPSSSRGNTYVRYLSMHEGAAFPREGVKIDLTAYNSETAEGVALTEELEGEGVALETTDTSFVEFSVNIPETGFYTLSLDYYPIESRGIDIERAFYINGEIPFLGADLITFYRIWSDATGGMGFDNQGNQIRASQIEYPRWERVSFTDSQGYTTEPYIFYFEKGENTIALLAVNEPMAIRNLEISPVREIPDYADYISAFEPSAFPGGAGTPIKVQGEDATRRSSPSLYPFFDTSSGTTEPYSATTIVLNAIGGERWRVPGQWIEWEIEVPENGFYSFSFKARQSYNRGIVSNRSLLINGEIPCREVMAIPFYFNNSWQLVTPTDDDGNELYFPLEKGTHTIRLQVTLGDLSTTLAQVEESIFRLNEIYRQILVLTGPDPDPYRDYLINEYYPEIMDRIAFESRYLYMLMDNIIDYAGQMGPEVATLQTIATQLELFVRKPHDIPRGVVVFKDNIAAVGTSLVSLNSSPLDIDWFVATDRQTGPPKVSENFFQSSMHEIRSFLATFFVDYDNIGSFYGDRSDVTEVWIFSGRDQSTVLKTMIDDTYTPETGNYVNLKLVVLDFLMPAVVAGTGPDVALTVNNADPINYAFRNAAMDLTRFNGFQNIAAEFHESAFVPFEYQGGIYGMPQTQLFGVMFYRTDILDELGISPPQTWDEVIDAFPVLQNRNLSIGIPSIERKIGNMVVPDLSNFFSQLYQRGGALYTADGSRSRFDDEQTVAAFEAYTKFFTHYKAPLHYEFANRFRSGEMPLGFADYDVFNLLQVFAPEIRGLWRFDLLPGTLKPDNVCSGADCCISETCFVETAGMVVCHCKIDRSTASWGHASMILSNAKEPLKAWEFMRWWASSETQLRFGRELEAIMGTAARYQTANREAFRQLGWNSRDSAVLDTQWDWIVGTPEVPGGYFAGRHIVFAVRRVINDSVDIRETLLDATRDINDELMRKRREFGLE
ncbi:MAG: extracellular solute-binding protein [Oscillospiraceae bacterium]|nr:extracellular solute-binding protein [Oscillospiraceae bacterium]